MLIRFISWKLDSFIIAVYYPKKVIYVYPFKHNFITKRIKFSRHLPEAQTIEWRIIASLVSYIRVLQTLLKYAKQEVLCENVFHRRTRN